VGGHHQQSGILDGGQEHHLEPCGGVVGAVGLLGVKEGGLIAMVAVGDVKG
jgi:hypothetical protein